MEDDGVEVEDAGVAAAVESVKTGNGGWRKRENRDKREREIMNRGGKWSNEATGRRRARRRSLIEKVVILSMPTMSMMFTG